MQMIGRTEGGTGDVGGLQVAYQPFVEEFLGAITGNVTGRPPPAVWVDAILDALPLQHLDLGAPLTCYRPSSVRSDDVHSCPFKLLAPSKVLASAMPTAIACRHHVSGFYTPSPPQRKRISHQHTYFRVIRLSLLRKKKS